MINSSDQSFNSSRRNTKLSGDQPNIQRRRIVQGAVLSTTAMAVPALASAICTSDAHTLAQAKNTVDLNSVLTSEDVAMELIETETSVRNGQLARVTITNNSNRPIKLSHVSPGAISTQKGVYQLNATLSNNPLSLRSGGVYQFWLTPDDGTQALLSRKPKPVSGATTIPTTVEVSVVTKLDSGPWNGTQRLQAIIS